LAGEGDTELDVIVTVELGDTSYLLISEGEAALVDPQRDAWRFVAAAEARRATIRHVLETHVHNDYVSGALEARAATGAQIAAPADGGYAFPHHAIAEGDEIHVGALTLTAWHTPGHTPEHTSYVVRAGGADDPVAVFTGGSMIVGAAGRTDLLGLDHTDELSRAQFHSLGRLAGLPDAVRVLPTHGAGSFCSAGSGGGARTSTIGAERLGNEALAITGEDDFVRLRTHELPRHPSYYRFMAPINRAGPAVVGRLPAVPALDVGEVERLAASGTRVVDTRDRGAFAEAHITGSVNVELGGSFSAYVGWLFTPDQPLVLVVPEPAEASAERAATQLFRIGFEGIVGYLAGGLDVWRAEDRPVSWYGLASVEELCREAHGEAPPFVLDVRQPVEHREGMFAGSHGLFVADLPGRLDEVPRDREAWVVCASGLRASVAASLLDAAGRPVRLVAERGVTDLLAECPPPVP
jgi:glyoxylase-like metal-dependent hydrolase (beta-lactamase superfamily II)/rhodanese-related sulfurtransferase